MSNSSFFQVDDAEFQAWVQEVQSKADPEKIKYQMTKSVKRVGVQMMRTVKNNTPEDTGHLKRMWHLENAGLLANEIYNNTEYASFVENGHRTRGGGGWVPGQFFLRDSVEALKSQLGELITPQFQKILEGML